MIYGDLVCDGHMYVTAESYEMERRVKAGIGDKSDQHSHTQYDVTGRYQQTSSDNSMDNTDM